MSIEAHTSRKDAGKARSQRRAQTSEQVESLQDTSIRQVSNREVVDMSCDQEVKEIERLNDEMYRTEQAWLKESGKQSEQLKDAQVGFDAVLEARTLEEAHMIATRYFQRHPLRIAL